MTERLHFHFSLLCIGEGNGNLLQYSCLENPRDRGAWWAAVYGVTQSRTRLKRLSGSSSSVYMFLPEQRSLAGYSPWSHKESEKNRTRTQQHTNQVYICQSQPASFQKETETQKQITCIISHCWQLANTKLPAQVYLPSTLLSHKKSPGLFAPPKRLAASGPH